MAQEGPYYLLQCGGPDCVECCPVYKECDICDCLSVVMDYVEYVKNRVKRENLGISTSEVTKAGMLLVGFSAMGTYWRPEIDGEVVNTYGRSMVVSDVNFWGVPGSDYRGWFQFILRVMDIDRFSEFGAECGCNPNDLGCLEAIFETMRSYLEIGGNNQPPYTLAEWDQKLCGVCYPECP